MQNIRLIATTLAVALCTSGAAQAAKCGMAGSWYESFGRGTITMLAKKGSMAVSYCAGPYKIKLSDQTKRGFNVTATYRGKDTCVSGFTEVMQWTTDCSVATGTIHINGGGSGTDTWTQNTGAK